MTQDDIEAAALIDECDQLQDAADSEPANANVVGSGCLIFFTLLAAIILLIWFARSLA